MITKVVSTKLFVPRAVYIALLKQDAHDWSRKNRQVPSGITSPLAEMCQFLEEEE